MKLIYKFFPITLAIVLVTLVILMFMMRGNSLFPLIFLTVLILMEIYALNGFLSLVDGVKGKWGVVIVYVLITGFAFYGFTKLSHGFRSEQAPTTWSNFLIGFGLTVFLTKMVFVFFLGFQDIGRAITGIIQYLNPNNQADNYLPSRRKALTTIATGIAAIPFFSMLYGITKGKYKFTVNKVKLAFSDLPSAFDGFKIVQISDVHAGSWDDKDEVARGISMIQDQNPDVFVFTGDLVNSKKDEINPFIDLFASIEAKHGKYAVLGNHDYWGVNDLDDAEHKGYWDDFFGKYAQMGFDLLNNENRKINLKGEEIALIGVENWGAGRWFPKEGDLNKALTGVNNDDFCVLLSHDPTHWDEHVIPNNKQIHLTLSGHTHGMQFGLNLPGFKWSPVKWRYKHWMGLYEKAKQYLYVNRGFGYLGFPGRVGMWPEITVIELKKG